MSLSIRQFSLAVLTAFVATLTVAVDTAAQAQAAIEKDAYARWSADVVNVYVHPDAKASGWSVGRSLRAWSRGPVQLRVVADPTKASITIAEIPKSRRFNGNAHYVHFDGSFASCTITLADNTWPRKRAHVAAHEIGHCLGLPHVSEYSSIMDVWLRGPWTTPTDLDIDWLRRSYASRA